MENLPAHIEQKIENLPIVPFDESEDFQKILFCADFNDIFSFYKENYLPDTLKAKPEIYQRVSLYLTLTGQGDAFTEQTDSVLYRRPVPPIEEFLSNKFFMGYSNATLYPYWKEKLEEIFKTGSPIRKVIFSGCIGCLTKDTIIATLNGDKTIEELLNNYDNEWALSYNTTTNTWEPDKIIDVFYTGHRDVYEITLDNDEKIRCTDNHQFLTRKNKWVSIKDGTLVPGLSMMPCSDPKLKARENHKCKESFNREIKSIRSVGKEDVYDITTEKNHNFALKSGIIAHNSGKSTVARKAFVYVLYRILCLRYPRATFNIDEDATIANVIISMTLRQVYDTNVLPFVKLMESMPCFQRVMSQRSFENFDLTNPNCPIPFVCEKSTGNIYFPDNIIITCGSNQGHFTGYNVVNSFCFTGDTKVYTDKGVITFKELTDRFNNGEKFKTLTLDSQCRRRITEITNALETTRTQDLIRIYYTDEDYIECTPTHPFIIKNPKSNDINIKYENGIPYKQAQYLTEKDELYDVTPVITKEELEELYIKQGFSLQMVAEHLNTSWSSIFRLCKRYGIHKEVITVHRKKNAPFSNKRALYSKVSKEQLYDLYITKNLSYKELAAYFKTCVGTIKTTLRRYNIKKPQRLSLANHKKTILSKYGVEHYSKSKRFKEQLKQTNLKNCGYASNFQSPEWKKRMKEQNLKKLNVENIMQLSATKQKVKQTKLKRYGDENYNNTALAQQTNLERYGVKSYSKTQEFREKQAETCLKKYGETSNFKTKEFREQSKKTCLRKYGVENAMQLESTRQKVFLSKKLNKTTATSSFEEKIFALLTTKFSVVERQYSSKEYPFACDFYIPELKLYIEYQGHFSHNTHAFDSNNNSDLQTVEKWKAKNKQSYDQAITVWTIRDPLKRETARKNNLNWIEFFNMEQFMEWYNEN